MSRKAKETKELPQIEVAALKPTNDDLVEVQALRQVNTSLYGNIREGEKGKVSRIMAQQLEKLGEVKILK